MDTSIPISPDKQSKLNINHRIVTFNIHGYNQGVLEVNFLCNVNKTKIIFIQEHWQSTERLKEFDQFKKDYIVFSC